MRTAVLAATFIWAAGQAAACTCVGSSFEESLRRTDLVFEGTVESVGAAKADLSMLPPDAASGTFLKARALKSARFRVTREIKGVGAEFRDIEYVQADGGNCGADFSIGGAYRVFAYRQEEGGFSTSGCSGNTTLGEPYLGVSLPEDEGEAIENLCKTKDVSERILKFYALESRILDSQSAYTLQEYLSPFEGVGQSKDARTLVAAGNRAKEWRDFERMATIYERFAELFPKDARGWTGLGQALLFLDQSERALNAFERAAALDPTSEETRGGLRKARLIALGAGTAGETDYRDLIADEVSAPGIVARGIDLSGARLRRALFGGADLTGAGFRAASISEGNFEGAKLAGARFEWAGQYGVAAGRFYGDFSNAILSGASLSEADLDGSKFDGADLAGARAVNAQLFNASFKGVAAKGIDLTGSHLENADFRDANLKDAVFDKAYLSDARLEGADLSGARLENAEKTTGARIDCATRLPFGLSVRKTQLIPVEPICGAIEQNRNFSDQEWFYTDFKGLPLASADFRKARLESPDFLKTNLASADFSGAELIGGSFQGADLTNARFIGTKVRAEFAAGTWIGSAVRPAATLNATDFASAEVEAGGFLGYDGVAFSFALDLESAKFDRTKLKCAAAQHRREIKYYEDERRRASTQPAKMRDDRRLEFLKRDRDEAISYLAAEEQLVRYLKSRWDSLVLDEECQTYFAPRPAN